ncbi:Ig-like domain-containing protein [Rhodopseudomonas sp. NSM]|uniref:Ig-like domain-containing protein n=1 Tax=Rhodopseudomonas sp. NSM TaxID=3457630 RepID=UPI0040368BB1
MRWLYLRGLALAASLLPVVATGAAFAQYEIISEPTTITVSASADPAALGRATLSAELRTELGAGVADGRITFLDLTTMRVLGWTSVAQPRLTVEGLAPGRHALRADYSGSASLLPVIALPSQSAEVVLDVPAIPGVSLSSSDDITAPGDIVTFTATVTGSGGAPGGTVTFRDGDSVMAADVPLDRAGTAAFTTSALPDGARRIIVEYQGDARYAKATAQIEQRVTAAVAAAEPRM